MLSLVLGYGDSTDHTDALLFEACSGGIGARLIDCAHGGPAYTSVVDAQRFKQLAFVGNKIFANVPDDADAIIWLESDLIWSPETIVELLNHLQWHACVAPAIMDSPPANTWYDSWAFRKDGLRFTKEPPFHPSLSAGMNKMDSVGSCVAINVPEFHRLTVPDDTVIVGVCEQIRALGGSVWCDTSLTVYHP